MIKYIIKFIIKSCILFAFLFSMSFALYKMGEEEEKKAVVIDCKLLNRDVKIDRGVKVFISLFDCGNYGILTSNNKEVFRQAKENNKLSVYINGNDYKIFNITN